jgi:hypothetical protein
VDNWMLRALGWIEVKKDSKQARNRDISLLPEQELMRLRAELLRFRKRDARLFITRVFNSWDSVWVERCSRIIKEKREDGRVRRPE